MPSLFDSPELTKVRSEAQTAASAYSSASAAGISLPDMLRDALTKKFSTSNPLIQQREGAVKTYMTESANAPLAVTPKSAGGQADVVYTPLEQASLIAGRRAASMAPLTSINALLGLTQSGMENIIGATGRAYQGQVEGMKANAESKRLTYTDLLTELSKKADEAYREKELALKASGARTTTGMTQDVLNQIADFVSKGGNDPELLDSTMRKFGTSGYVKPEDILRVYNTYSPHGPAIETPEELSKKYGIKSTETAEQRNRKSALKPALLAIDKALGETYKQTGPVNFLERLKVEKLGGLGANQELVRQNQAFQLLRQNVVRALQGARMSDIDIELAQQYIPNIGDTADTINTKLIGLKSFVEGLVGIGSTEVRPPLSSFEY